MLSGKGKESQQPNKMCAGKNTPRNSECLVGVIAGLEGQGEGVVTDSEDQLWKERLERVTALSQGQSQPQVVNLQEGSQEPEGRQASQYNTFRSPSQGLDRGSTLEADL